MEKLVGWIEQKGITHTNRHKPSWKLTLNL